MATDTTTRAEEREPLVGPGHTPATVTDEVSDFVLKRPVSRGWLVGLALSFALVTVLLFASGYLLLAGVGIWGVNVPVG